MDSFLNYCRSWFFVHGGEDDALSAAPSSGSDVLIQELEDFTPPALLPHAREIAPEVYAHWRTAGAVVAVRVNPLDAGGMDDLAAVMRGAPDIVALPKVSGPEQISALDGAVARFEREHGLAEGKTRLLPNLESAKGLTRLADIVSASPRTIGCVIASEDLAADLGAERGPDGLELAYARQRFLFDCVAAGTIAIDCPYTWRDLAGLESDTRWAKRLGYKAKSVVASTHAATINAILTPSQEEIEEAKQIVRAFDDARAKNLGRAEVDGSLVELPTYLNAKRLLERAEGITAHLGRPARR